MKRLVVEITDTAHGRLKTVAASDNTSMKHLVELLANALWGDPAAMDEFRIRTAIRDKRLPSGARIFAEEASVTR